MLGGGHRYDYETEALIIASRRGYAIESVPITTTYTDQVNEIHPGREALRFFQNDAALWEWPIVELIVCKSPFL